MSEDRRSSSAKKRSVKPSEEDERKASATQEKARQALKKRKKNSIWDQYSYHIIIGGFALVVIVTLLSTIFGKTKKLHLTPVIESDEIEAHNHHHQGFQLGPNQFFQDWTLADAKKILNNFFAFKQSLSRCTTSDENSILETRYDFREAHPECVSPVQDQKNCSSSFAVAAASALSDRFCKQTHNNVRLSSQHFLSCQEDNEGKVCEAGGAIASFLDYSKRKGIVDENCFPYEGENNVPCNLNAIKQCQFYQISDYCVATEVEGIKRDILKYGPSVGYLPVFRDFLVYKSGVYHVIDGTSKFQGGHALKIIGWDQTQEGEKYWIVENTWGDSWGDKGYGKIAIGQEELFLDQYAFSPNPKVEKVGYEEIRERERERPDLVNLDT